MNILHKFAIFAAIVVKVFRTLCIFNRLVHSNFVSNLRSIPFFFIQSVVTEIECVLHENCANSGNCLIMKILAEFCEYE